MKKRISYFKYFDFISKMKSKGRSLSEISNLLIAKYSEFKNTNYRIIYRRLYDLVQSDKFKKFEKRKEEEDLQVESKTETSSNDYFIDKTILSAISPNGKIMNIDEYCQYHNLPRDLVSSYKLITHTGIPYYNTVFKEVDLSDLTEDDIIEIVNKQLERAPKKYQFREFDNSVENFDRLIYSDVHINMDPNPNEESLYSYSWRRDDIIERIEEMVSFAIENKTSDTIIVDDLGDYMDGQEGKTLRKGHDLPQYYTDAEAFDIGVEIKVLVADLLFDNFKSIVFNNVVNDNHSGKFSYYVNSTAKRIVETKYKNSRYNILSKFFEFYTIGNKVFILCHGKDNSQMKSGMPVIPTKDVIKKIDNFCKSNNLYSNKEVFFCKGDSHQWYFDGCSSPDFRYYSYPCLCPPSNYSQINFATVPSGFVLESYGSTNSIKPYLFNKNYSSI